VSAAAKPLVPEHHFEIGRDHHGVSLFDFLDSAVGPVDRQAVQRAARAAELILNGEPAGPSVTLRLGDLLDLLVPVSELVRPTPTAVPVLFRDEQIVVGSKPSGMTFDAGRLGDRGSALARLRAEAGLGDVRPRPVHRLDKDTSGLVVAALGRDAERTLSSAFAAGEARVEYLAIVRTTIKTDGGEIDVPLGKKLRSDQVLRPDPDHGQPCLTRWAVAERLRGFTVLRLRPLGGRSHQVRAHLAARGHPVLCDAAYLEDSQLLLSQLKLHYRPKRGRPERPLLTRPALHAERFRWGDREVVAPLPDDLSVVLRQLRRLRPLD